MSFLHPEFLYLMLPPLFILFAFLLTQKESQGHFFSDEVLSKLRVSANTLTIKARNALFFLMGILIIIALAGPVIKDGTVEIKAKSADIMIALDISDSMLAEDVYPNRLKLAKQKAIELLKIAPNERIGVVAFAKNSYMVSPVSFDHDAVGFLLSQLNTDSITEKGTDFLSLLSVADKSVKEESKKYLLILSDGGDSTDFSKEIAFAKENDIVVYILGIGTKKGAPIKLENGAFIKHKGEIIISKLNENISKLATSTGGVYIESVKSNDDIKSMLSEIENSSEQKELKSEKIQKYIPLFYFPLGLALIILLIATSSMSKREVVHVPSIFILFALLFSTPDVKAGVLDFMELNEAKEAYNAGDYEKAQSIYSKYANSSKSSESFYNEGNSFYKQGKYPEAVEAYKKATFDNEFYRANNFANIGNAYAKQGKIEDLQKAIESYEESLKLKEDKEVRENLEAVKKALQKQKNDKKNQDKNKDKDKKNQDKDKKDQDKKNQDKDKKDSEKNKDKDKKNQDKNKDDSKDKEKSDKKKDSSDNDKSKDDKKEDSKDMKSKKNEEDKKNQEKQDKKNKESKQEKKDNLKELNKDKIKDSGSAAQDEMKQQKMSDAEEQKWLKQLNEKQSTFLYMLNNKPKKRDENEKPW